MHPADQFEAFRTLVDDGSSVADIAARFGMAEKAVKQRLRLARVSPTIFEAYRGGELTLEQVQAFAVSDDHAAQERVFGELSHRSDPEDIRSALTQDDIAATDKRARFITLPAYEEAGGDFRRDLFAEGDEFVFLLDSALLDRLAMEKLQAEAETLKAEGWKWVEAVPELDYEARGDYRVRRPEPLPLSEAAAAEQKALAEEYDRLFNTMEEGNEETSVRLDEIEARINELEETESAYPPDVLAIAGAIVTIGSDGESMILRGIVRPEDEPEEERKPAKVRPEFSAALVESLTEAKSAAIGVTLAGRPDVALAAVVHALASDVFHGYRNDNSLRISGKVVYFKEESEASGQLKLAYEEWFEKLPKGERTLWDWCLEQDQSTLLELLAFCAACTVDAVQRKQDVPDGGKRIAQSNALATALSLDMTKWFTPTADNFFSRVGRTTVVAAITEAKGTPAKRSWDKLKKSGLAALAEREIAGTGWLPQPLKAA
jgi:ParB family chromosome partitioning protein